MNARALAAHVLVRVWSEGAYAAASLSAELDRGHLEPRDRGLATELTYGVLRTQKYLETRLSTFGKLKAGDHALMAHLLVGAYQVEFLDRVPARAAVSEAVSLVNQTHDRRVGGFCNAVLRRLSEDSDGRKSLAEAALSSAPSWLKKRLTRDVGEVGARALLTPGDSHSLTLRTIGMPSPEFAAFLAENAQPCAGVPQAFRYLGGGDPRKTEWFAQGRFVVQELGAQLVAHALGAQPGERVLDVCAGRGQKTSLLAEQVGPNGQVVAADIHEHKVRELEGEMHRLGLDVAASAWDFTQAPPEAWWGAFDRVLVDAPCTGVGTLMRRPEIARRLSSEDPARLAELQRAIAGHAARCLKPGGVLLFATCSVLREEAEDVVEALLRVGLRPTAPPSLAESALFPTGPPSACFRLLPQLNGTDGYFIARLAN